LELFLFSEEEIMHPIYAAESQTHKIKKDYADDVAVVVVQGT
jgi:hypothetical protein